MTIKKIIILALFILLAFFLYGEEDLKREFPLEPGKLLDIDLKTGGTLSISGWEKPKVSVNVNLKKGDADDWDISFQQKSEGVFIESRLKSTGYSYNTSPIFSIRVPQKINLKLKTLGGDIIIRHIDGEIIGKTMGGKLKLSRLKGNIDMKTMGGEISLTDSNIDGKVKTMGGRVLLENITGDVSGNSMGGNVIYKNVKSRSGKSTGRVVQISTLGGAINVSDAPYGANAHTMGGNIHIKSAKEFIKAKTMGGDITVDSIDGWIKATTMGGNISVTMTGNPEKGNRDVNLTSMGGEITLTVPDGISMDYDLEIECSKSNCKYYITSDFQKQKESFDSTGKSENKKRKHISAKATIRGGKHKIKIKTIDGNINLKRGKQ